MKRLVAWGVLPGIMLLLNSCKEKEPEPIPIIVGEWTLDGYLFTEIPANFDYWEGLYDGQIFGEESNHLTFEQGGTYKWKIGFSGADFNDNGKWVLEGDNLTLDSDDADNDDEEFTVDEEITANELLISQVQTLNLLPTQVVDTLTTAEWGNEALINELYAEYGAAVNVKVISLYEK